MTSAPRCQGLEYSAVIGITFVRSVLSLGPSHRLTPRQLNSYTGSSFHSEMTPRVLSLIKSCFDNRIKRELWIGFFQFTAKTNCFLMYWVGMEWEYFHISPGVLHSWKLSGLLEPSYSSCQNPHFSGRRDLYHFILTTFCQRLYKDIGTWNPSQ